MRWYDGEIYRIRSALRYDRDSEFGPRHTGSSTIGFVIPPCRYLPCLTRSFVGPAGHQDLEALDLTILPSVRRRGISSSIPSNVSDGASRPVRTDKPERRLCVRSRDLRWDAQQRGRSTESGRKAVRGWLRTACASAATPANRAGCSLRLRGYLLLRPARRTFK